MAKRRRSKVKRVNRIAAAVQARRNEIGGFALVAFCLLLLLSLVSYDRFDTGLHTSDPNTIRNNVVGIVGAYLAEGAFFPFGLAAFAVPVVCAYWAWRVFFGAGRDERWIKAGGLVLLVFAYSAALTAFGVEWNGSEFDAGGMVGYYVNVRSHVWFGPLGSRVLYASLTMIGLLLATDLLMVNVFGGIGRLAQRLGLWSWETTRQGAPAVWRWTARQAAATREFGRKLLRRREGKRERRGPVRVLGLLTKVGRPKGRPRISGASDSARQYTAPAPEPEPVAATAEPAAAAEASGPRGFVGRISMRPADTDPDEAAAAAADAYVRDLAEAASRPRKRARATRGQYAVPPIDLFTESVVSPAAPTRSDFEAMAAKLEHALQTFGIEAEVLDVVRGPTITRFELRLAPGIKVSRVLALNDDLALAMEALRVRIEAPIPGRAAVGIEIPNTQRDDVRLRDVLTSRVYKNSKQPLALVLGKDIAGASVVMDLAAMPHLLIAGATGAGKTVCVNTLILSLLYRNTPDTLRLLLIDPKMIELSQYDGIPHLLWPVVTDAQNADRYLQWLVREMENRYGQLAKARTRNIAAYNALVEQNIADGRTPLADDEEPDPHTPVEPLPYIVAVIDELADLMMVSPREVEESIARLAQLARAVGIHLILATQRPSVDVITGVIKANFPARISFAVRSKVDSRTVLDSNGAEQLIGQGDALYLPAGQSRPLRVQSAFVSDGEINAVVTHYSAQGEPDYLDADAEFEQSGVPGSTLDAVDDDLFIEAVKLVITSGHASISMLQRRLRVGYARAARLIDTMELQGIVGPGEGSKPRELLVGLEFLERLNDPTFA